MTLRKIPSYSYRKQLDTKDQSNVSLGLKSKNHRHCQLHQKVTSFSMTNSLHIRVLFYLARAML
jgi:hypothetical protein